MEHYELLYIIKESYPDNEIPSVHERVRALIQKVGGALTKEEPLGRKRLAYPIKRQQHGFYYLTELNIEEKETPTLDRQLRLHEDILRHILLRKKVKTEEALEKERKLQERISRRRSEERRLAEGATTEKPIETAIPVTAEELDKKLEEILEKPDSV